MQYLLVENASKSYGEKVLFKDVKFSISLGDKIALIAKNGSGKTTLLRIIAGEEGVEGENAKIHLAKNVKTAFLNQEPDLDDDHTVNTAIFDSDNPSMKAVKDYETAMALNDMEAIEKASIAMDDHKAWDFEAKVSTILAKLKIDRLDEKIGNLSGGQRKRVALAKMIIEEPEFLILDEPTNHLDIDMIEWLEDYLASSKLTLFMVTHDRYFLEKVCNTIFELDRGEIHTYTGNYVQYLEKKDARLQNEAVNYEKNKKLYRKELDWMRRQPQARTTKAKSRISEFYGIEDKVKNKREEDDMSIQIETARLGSKILELHNISKSFGEINIVEGFSYKFKKGERVGIVGQNGAGKSTFVKLLIGQLKSDTGKIVIGETLKFGYYDQEGLQLGKDKMVIEVIRDIADYIPLAKGLKLSAESLLEKFLFPRSQQRVYVSQLSGGEKRRLYLLTVLVENPNFLILDEPTNDLDIMTLNVLEDYLQDYPGCLMIISHDRYFVDKLVDHIFVVEGGGSIRDYNGSYTEYRLEKAKELKASREQKTEVDVPAQKSSGKSDFELQKEIKSIEKKIEKLEKRKTEIENAFMDTSLSPEKITDLSQELGKVKEEIEEHELQWMEVTEELEG